MAATWRNRQPLPVVVSAGCASAALGIGSTVALPPRRMSSKTRFKQMGRAAEDTMIASGLYPSLVGGAKMKQRLV